jgi:uncharacterized protein (TIGR01244 family)
MSIKLPKKLVFAFSFIVGMVYILISSYINRPIESKIHSLTKDVFVTGQLVSRDIFQLKRDGYASIIDIRPDGEATDQIPSTDVARLSNENKIKFVYIPVPRDAIPAESVAELSTAIANSPKPILLYCRIGRRAVRTFGLVEASRVDGPDASTILAMVQSVGYSAEDLTGEINRRIANRRISQGAKE